MTRIEREGRAGKFSLLPLLIAGRTLSAEIRRALRENRLREAAADIMREYGLSCVEVEHLLDFDACAD